MLRQAFSLTAVMTLTLQQSVIGRKEARIGVELYHRTDEYAPSGRRTELIRGLIVEKMSKSPLHTKLLSRLFRRVQAASDRRGLLIRKDEPLTLADSEPEPDISVVAGAEEDYDEAHPATAELAIEVAVTSEELDREKIAIYAEAGVKEYWLVLGKRAMVEVFSDPWEGGYRQRHIYSRGEVIISRGVPGLVIDLSELFPG